VFVFLGASFRTRAALQLEILALRHQIVLQRSVKRPKLTPADRVLWAWLCSVWKGWEARLAIVKADTVTNRSPVNLASACFYCHSADADRSLLD
jgi:hypothetical protein